MLNIVAFAMPEKLTSVITLSIRKGLPFVLYRLPNTAEIILVVQKTGKPEERKVQEMESLKGFLVAGFAQMELGTVFLIKPDIVLKGSLPSGTLLKELEELPDVDELTASHDVVQSEEEYLSTVQNLIDKLKAGELQKVVLSRIVQAEAEKVDKGQLFTKLEQKYPDAFVYLMHLPRMGTWTGATPETLLKVGDGFAKTVALAGTMPVERMNWTDKEREEQQMVTDFIEEALVTEGISGFQKFGPFTLKAGKLAHLKTTFQISVEQLKGKTGSFIARLHPTPAVCGLPKEEAFELIRETEKHERELYTGFLGPWNIKGESALFVNLRCARLQENSASLFVGGGITAASIAADEWQETENKAETLLSVLKNL
ncbi:MAG: chorismate-binding protein [Bacteroidales bacterium]|nr:chorismate-binding protein [Bacteroidales bacterium]MCF6342027.1 chorismate-binding protein [Bacteroidales bacterium]